MAILKAQHRTHVNQPKSRSISEIKASINRLANSFPVYTGHLTKVVRKVACVECGKRFADKAALAMHTKAKHLDKPTITPTEALATLIKDEETKAQLRREAKERKREARVVATKESVEAMLAEDKERKNLAALKAAIHSELTKPEPPYFNKEAFSLALRVLTKPEAIKIAKSDQLATDFLAERQKSNLSPLGASVSAPKVEPIHVKAKTPRIAPRASQERLNVSLKGCKRETKTKQRDSAEQAAFKRRVVANYGGKCAITGDSLPILQACHIETHKEYYDHSTNNGILLNPSLHALFDAGLMGIEPNGLTIHFAVECIYSVYEGKKLADSIVALCREKLAKKWASYVDNKSKAA